MVAVKLVIMPYTSTNQDRSLSRHIFEKQTKIALGGVVRNLVSLYLKSEFEALKLQKINRRTIHLVTSNERILVVGLVYCYLGTSAAIHRGDDLSKIAKVYNAINPSNRASITVRKVYQAPTYVPK